VTAADTRAATARQLSAEALAVTRRFPTRPVPAAWKATAAGRFTVMRRMLAPPFLAENVDARHPRKLTMLKILDWLELHPGTTWQERWDSSGAGTDGTADWRDQAVAELEAAGKLGPRGGELHHVLGTGMVQLIGGDVLRPGLPWLLATTSPSRVAEEMGRTRDPAGIAALKKLREGGTIGRATFAPAVERVALIMAAKGGLVADITPGDCIELLDCCRLLFAHGTRVGRHSPFFYQLLHMAGVFPPGAPPTVRMINPKFAGQLSVEQLVDRYDLACRPVRDLLVDYLRERQPGIDYNTLVKLAVSVVLCFWKDLENCHPGIGSLHLPPDIAAGWKKRIKTRTVRTPGGGQKVVARQPADDVLMAIRGFYLDLAPVGPGRPRPLGTVGRPLPRPQQRHPVQEAEIPDQGPHGRPDPRTAPRHASPRRLRRPRAQGLRGPAARRPHHTVRRTVHRRRADPAPRPADPDHPDDPRLGRGPRQRETPGPDPGRRQRVLGMGRRRGLAPHRHQA